jgi:chorismate mutase
MNLQQLRKRISAIDTKLIKLIAKRQAYMPGVGKYKRDNNLPINQPKREKEILTELKRLSLKEGINTTLIEKVFTLLIKDAKRIQKESN